VKISEEGAARDATKNGRAASHARQRFGPRTRVCRYGHGSIRKTSIPVIWRGLHLLPKRGDKQEWQHTRDYWTEKDQFPAADLDGGSFVYE
jgi:hypothetical protein